MLDGFLRIKKKKESIIGLRNFFNKNTLVIEYLTPITAERQREVIFMNKGVAFYLLDLIKSTGNSSYMNRSIFYFCKEMYEFGRTQRYTVLDITLGKTPVYIIINSENDKLIVLSRWESISVSEEEGTYEFVKYLTSHCEAGVKPLIAFFEFEDSATVLSCLDMMVQFKLNHIPLDIWLKAMRKLQKVRDSIIKICEKNEKIAKNFIHKKKDLNGLYSIKVSTCD